MAEYSYEHCLRTKFLSNWSDIAKFRKPLIAAVNGYAVLPATTILTKYGS